MPKMDETTDAKLRSWVDVSTDSHFPIQNLPYGVAIRNSDQKPILVTAIGDSVLNLTEIEKRGVFSTTEIAGKNVFQGSSLNDFMSLGRGAWKTVRQALSRLFQADNPAIRDNEDLKNKVLIPASEVEMVMPVSIGDYTDFYSSREHATNVGTLIRGPEKALMPNWRHLPVAYHGRASSIIISGTPLHRPKGQTFPKDAHAPVFGPSNVLDFELEMGFFVGPASKLGKSISVNDAIDHIFGMVLVNDWSARDIQTWEYQPLGPFLAKNFGTTISPWIVTMDALAPFKCPAPEQDPKPLSYLRSESDRTYDIHLEVNLTPESSDTSETIVRSNFNYLYWDVHQQLAHHTVTGCNVRTGDLMASGTISGPAKKTRGSLLELTWRGEDPITLSSGETRKFLQDGDTVTLTGWCQGEGYRVGFGECTGKILPAIKE